MRGLRLFLIISLGIHLLFFAPLSLPVFVTSEPAKPSLTLTAIEVYSHHAVESPKAAPAPKAAAQPSAVAPQASRDSQAEASLPQPTPDEGAHEAEGSQAGVSAREAYLNELRTLVEERKVFPAASKRLGEAGRVLINFKILRDGRIADVFVKHGCPFARLNEAAHLLVAQLGHFKPLPREIGAEHLLVDLPIDYILK